MSGYVLTSDVIGAWLTWREHRKILLGYDVCDAVCGERWPCSSRIGSEQQLIGMGVDPRIVLQRARWRLEPPR